MSTTLRFKVKSFVNKDKTTAYRYYFIDDICAITGLTPRQIFLAFPTKGMTNMGGIQTLTEASVNQLKHEHPELIEACESALQVD
ncbi:MULTISPECIES: hypothetical protein [Enterobacter cloacae complex]|uniref:hypothetical protein n=1 Tax=Enterobacter cloacae complex TaxID=354276 RepID=UPI00345A1457